MGDTDAADGAGGAGGTGGAGGLLVGLDVIGDCLTEVNVTSPTCFQEIFDQTGFDVAAMFIDALEQAASASSNEARN